MIGLCRGAEQKLRFCIGKKGRHNFLLKNHRHAIIAPRLIINRLRLRGADCGQPAGARQSFPSGRRILTPPFFCMFFCNRLKKREQKSTLQMILPLIDRIFRHFDDASVLRTTSLFYKKRRNKYCRVIRCCSSILDGVNLEHKTSINTSLIFGATSCRRI